MVLFSIWIRRFLRPSPTLLIVAKPRFFKRPARFLDCLAAISIFHCRDIDLFIAAIYIFHRRNIDLFIAAISIFHRRDIDFFIAAISIFHRRDINFSSSRYRFFCPITAIFIRPYSRTPSRRPNAFLGSKFALVAPHLPLWHHICLMVPHMPHGAPMPSRRPHLP